MTEHKVIIIGSGPAGYTAAIYAARAQLNPILFEGAVDSGGALMTTTEVENFPGFRDGIMGPALMEEMRAQAERFGTKMVPEDIAAVKLTEAVKGVRTADGATYKAPSLILATGSAHRKLGIPREEELSGRGVSYCATCDGFFQRGKPIVVVGGGDSAVEEALFLTKFGSTVTMLVRAGELRASKIMQARAFASEKLNIVFWAKAHELVGDKELEAMVIEDTQTGELSTIPASGLFIAIGHDPRSSLVADYLPLNEAGYVLAEGGAHGATATRISGVFVAGDVADHRYRQAITAAGSGAQAAIDAERWLEAQHS